MPIVRGRLLPEVAKNSAPGFLRPTINFVEGSNISITVADDPGNDEVDVTIATTGTAAHASSHQDGGSDEIVVTGLSGLLADPQKVNVRKNSGGSVFTRNQLNFIEGSGVTLTVLDDGTEVDVTVAATTPLHATTHQDGGSDEISVTGLSGLLADPQTPLAHKSSHVVAGGDAFVAGDLLDATAKVQVRKNSGGSTFSRRRINLIEGGSMSITIADDSGSEEVDVTLSAPFAVTPASPDRSIQFNNSGSFGGSADLIWDLTSHVVVGGNGYTGGSNSQIHVVGLSASSDAGATISQHAVTANGPRLNFLKSRGGTTPTVASTSDEAGVIMFQAHNGTAFSDCASISTVLGALSGSNFPTDILLKNNNGSSLHTWLTVTALGNVVVNEGFLAGSATDGFLYIPGTLSTPSGTPTSYSGRFPLFYAAAQDRLKIYDWSWLDVGVVTVRKNSGADVGTRPRINLIEGSNVTLTVTDDGAGNEVDVTIASTGGSGGTPSMARTFLLMGA